MLKINVQRLIRVRTWDIRIWVEFSGHPITVISRHEELELKLDAEKLILYHYPATRSVRARWALLETVGSAFELKTVDLYGGDQYSSEFLKLNPNHNVPELEIRWRDGSAQVMLESSAIVSRLADAYPDQELAPAITSHASRAEYLKWLHFGASWMDMMLWQIRAHRHILSPEDSDPNTISRYENKFRNECEPQVAAQLEKTDFILGGQFTAADIIIGHNVFWARAYGLCQAEIFEVYVNRLMLRPSLQIALDDISEFSLEPAIDAPVREKFTG